MSKCKECLSEQVCRYNDGINLYCKDDYECPHYKTADVVEVVRCKECIYNEIGSCTHSQKYDEDNYRADYFCADGTPKERGREK